MAELSKTNSTVVGGEAGLEVLCGIDVTRATHRTMKAPAGRPLERQSKWALEFDRRPGWSMQRTRNGLVNRPGLGQQGRSWSHRSVLGPWSFRLVHWTQPLLGVVHIDLTRGSLDVRDGRLVDGPLHDGVRFVECLAGSRRRWGSTPGPESRKVRVPLRPTVLWRAHYDGASRWPCRSPRRRPRARERCR